MFLKQLTARVQKSAQVIARVSPLEQIAKSIQADVTASNSCLVQKDWGKWNDEHAKNGVGGNLDNPTAHKDSIPRGKRDEARHQKELGAENWHTRTMAQHRDKSNDALKYTINDAKAAIAANPDNPKSGQYMDEVHYANMELANRQKHFSKK